MRSNYSKQNRLSGWLKSKELRSLASPIAILLALLFTLSLHVNTAVAVGSSTINCYSATTLELGNGGTPSRTTILDHCPICVFSDDNPFSELFTDYSAFPEPVGSLADAKFDKQFIHRKSVRIQQIRAPPLS